MQRNKGKTSHHHPPKRQLKLFAPPATHLKNIKMCGGRNSGCFQRSQTKDWAAAEMKISRSSSSHRLSVLKPFRQFRQQQSSRAARAQSTSLPDIPQQMAPEPAVNVWALAGDSPAARHSVIISRMLLTKDLGRESSSLKLYLWPRRS